MALVDIDKLGPPRLNLPATLQSYEHGILRKKDQLDDAKAQFEKVKDEAAKIVHHSIIKAAGVPDGHSKVEVKLSRDLHDGEERRVAIFILISKEHEVKVIERLRKERLDFRVTPASEKRWGGCTKILLALHQTVSHSEARQPRPLR